MIDIKILSIRSNERYILRRLVEAALQELRFLFPALQVKISEIRDPTEISKYASALIRPTPEVNGKIVCEGRVPSRQEAVRRLREEMQSIR
jgi:hypothetical protein